MTPNEPLLNRVESLVETHGFTAVVHALTEACHGHTDWNARDGARFYRAEALKVLCAELTLCEAIARRHKL